MEMKCSRMSFGDKSFTSILYITYILFITRLSSQSPQMYFTVIGKTFDHQSNLS